MKNISAWLAVILVGLFWSLLANAQDVDIYKKYKDPIGQYIQIYQNKGYVTISY